MTGNLFIDAAVLAVSLFNTLLLLWLGLVVLLTAERRHAGIWGAGGALLLGGLFFLSHTAIVGGAAYGYAGLLSNLEFWWRIGWLPVVGLPLAWYGVILWYSGNWEAPSPHSYGFSLALLLMLLNMSLLAFTNALPAVADLLNFDLSKALSIGGAPLLLLVFPAYALLCTGLSLAALARPDPSRRMMGDLARSRARPWLMSASLALLLVSLLVGAVIAWLIWLRPRLGPTGPYPIELRSGLPLNDGNWLALAFGGVDLLIAGLISLSILLVGQAVVSYEIFSGLTLPRSGLRRYWRRAILLAAGFALAASLGLAFSVQPIHTVLLALVVVAVFYALLSWRSFAEREHQIEGLRPFVSSQRLYGQILTAEGSEISSGLATFTALCVNVLNARQAHLIPLGPLAALAGEPLSYPANVAPPSPLGGLGQPAGGPGGFDQFNPQTLCVALKPQDWGGAAWAVPLWNEQTLIGLLLLGDKRDGNLYTQEEMEIARAAGERLVDLRAAAEVARRLLALQRQRLAEHQVLDRRARRTLHDEVLPALHSALLSLGADPPPETVAALTDAHRQIAALLRQSPPPANPRAELAGGLGSALRRLVEEELRPEFDAVSVTLEPVAESRAAGLPPLTIEVLYYAAREAVRNAARYGRDPNAGAAPLHLKLEMRLNGDRLQIQVSDNGIGLGESAAAQPLNGSGQGLSLHGALLAVLGGELRVSAAEQGGTVVTADLPLNL